MKKHILISFLSLIIVVLSVPLSQGADSESLADYLSQALAGNDGLQRARADFMASSENSRRAGVMPDPVLSLQYYLEPVETRTGPQNGAVGISQSVPWFGKLSLARELSDHSVGIASSRLAAVELDVARQVKESYVEYAFLRRSQQSIKENIELLRYLEGVARSRYSGGKTTFFDVLKIQLELSQSLEKEQALVDQAQPLRVHINGLLGVEAERVRVPPLGLPQVVLSMDEDLIISLGLNKSPRLAQAQYEIARARTAKELAEKDYYPDFNLSVKTILTGSAEYGSPAGSGDDPIIAGLALNIPIFRDRRHAAVAEQEAKISSANSFKMQESRLLQTRIEQGLYAYREAGRKFALYRDDLLPKVKQQLEVAVNGFQNGEMSILELIDAEKNLLGFELAENRALADRALAVARLESMAGAVLGDWSE